MAGANFKPSVAARDQHNSPFSDNPSARTTTHHQGASETGRRPFVIRNQQLLDEDPFVENGGPSIISTATEEDKERARRAKVAQKMLRENHGMGTILLKPETRLSGNRAITPRTAASGSNYKTESTPMHSSDERYYTPPSRQRNGHQKAYSSGSWATELSLGGGFSPKDEAMKPETSAPTSLTSPRDGNRPYPEDVNVLAGLGGSRFVPSDFMDCSSDSEDGPLSPESAWKVAMELEDEERRILAAIRSRQI